MPWKNCHHSDFFKEILETVKEKQKHFVIMLLSIWNIGLFRDRLNCICKSFWPTRSHERKLFWIVWLISWWLDVWMHFPAGNYMFKVNNRNSKTGCEICSRLTIKTPERHHCGRSGVFIVNFDHISHLFVVFLLISFSR